MIGACHKHEFSFSFPVGGGDIAARNSTAASFDRRAFSLGVTEDTVTCVAGVLQHMLQRVLLPSTACYVCITAACVAVCVVV